MRRCAYLSMHSLEDFECYDHLTYQPMLDLGWQVSEVPWRETDVDWNHYEAVVIRSPWDYQDHSSQFLDVLETIESSKARLLNPLSLVRWNIDKRYLLDFESRGVAIVPTRWLESFEISAVEDSYAEFGVDELIIKPCISANADDTFRLKQADLQTQCARLELSDRFHSRPHMLQPFVESVIAAGEVSLFYFNGKLSHAIRKTPKTDDFRVQEEHGGKIELIDATDELMKVGEKVIDALDDVLLYARVDLVQYKNQWMLMELEAIEPSLYFNMAESSAHQFAEAFNEMLDSGV